MAKYKLQCNKCGGKMRIDPDGVTMVGGGPGPAPIVKLRCDKCDITRFEQRSDIERELAESGEPGKTAVATFSAGLRGTDTDGASVPPTLKQRHGCLLAYLILMLVANSATILIYLLGAEGIRRNSPNMPDWAFPVLVVIGIVNLIFALALLRWQKWGFWGYAVSTVVVFFINLSIGVGLVAACLGLLGLPILYGVLHIGKEKKGWPQLD